MLHVVGRNVRAMENIRIILLLLHIILLSPHLLVF